MVMVLTSFILYLMPQGRVAYWADWRLLGLSKEQWGALHINIGVLFILSLVLHLYYNWQPVIKYLKNSKRKLQFFTKECFGALILLMTFGVGTYLELPPFSSIIAGSDTLKERAAQKYGEPPYGHAELSSLHSFSRKMSIDSIIALAALREAGIEVENHSMTLKEIGRENDVSPQHLYEILQENAKKTLQPAGLAGLPESPVPGTGNMRLEKFCSQYGLSVDLVLSNLKKMNIEAEQDMTLKEIARMNDSSPQDIYEIIRSASIEASMR